MNSSIIQEKKELFSKSNYSELKIKQLPPKIIQSIKDNLITFISSKAGSGKSTQVPQYLYDYLLNEKKETILRIMHRAQINYVLINFKIYWKKKIKI